MAKDDLVMFDHEFDGVEHLIAKDQFGVDRDFIRPNNIMVISENNTYPVKDCKEVDVQLPPQKAVKLQIAENGEFTPDTYSGEYYNDVTVQMATELTDEEITITENGTYKPSTGKMFSKVTVDVPCDTMVGYDEWGNPVTPYVDPTTGKLEIDKLPDHIKVTVLPTKTDYIFGEKIDYSGIEVRAYNKDGSLWTKMGYKNGIIPFNELIFLTDKLGNVIESNNDSLISSVGKSGIFHLKNSKEMLLDISDNSNTSDESIVLSDSANIITQEIVYYFKWGSQGSYYVSDFGIGNINSFANWTIQIDLNDLGIKKRVSPVFRFFTSYDTSPTIYYVWEISNWKKTDEYRNDENASLVVSGDIIGYFDMYPYGTIRTSAGATILSGWPYVYEVFQREGPEVKTSFQIFGEKSYKPSISFGTYDKRYHKVNSYQGHYDYDDIIRFTDPTTHRAFGFVSFNFFDYIDGTQTNVIYQELKDYMPNPIYGGHFSVTTVEKISKLDIDFDNIDGCIKFLVDALPDPNNDDETDNQLMYDVVIPFNCPPIYQAQSDLDCGITQPILFSQWGIAQTGIVGSIIYEYDIEGASVTFAYTPDSGGFYFVVASQDRNTKAAITVKKYNVATNELISAETNTININTSYSYDDKTVYFYRGTVTTKGSLEVAVPVATTSQAGIFRNHEGQIAWTMIYGENITDTTKVSQPVRVQWKRPGDKKTLETTMELNVLIPKAKRT